MSDEEEVDEAVNLSLSSYVYLFVGLCVCVWGYILVYTMPDELFSKRYTSTIHPISG